MNRYRCGKCGQKISERNEECPFCGVRLVYSRKNEQGAIMTAAFSFLLLLYLAFFFGLFYEKINQYAGASGLAEKVQTKLESIYGQ